MATLDDLKNAVDNILNITAAKKILQLNSNTCERAYEAYIFSLCARAVERAGGTIIYTGIVNGANPPVIVFRGAPGAMHSRGQDFCYADCTLQSERFEIHVDVEYEGQSEAIHEIDVSICDSAHCQNIRASGRLPRTRKNLVMLFECKFYTTPPGVSLARTFVGLRIDCTGYQLSGFICNQANQGLRDYLSNKGRPNLFTPLPSDTDSEELFIRSVEKELRRWARL